MSAAIQGIYIALFGRPADPGGLAYWTEVTKGGADLSAMLSVLPNLTEYTARFEGQTPDQVITTVYQNLFGRAPDAEGLAFFKGQLASGAQTLATIAVNIMQGAQGDDKADVTAKVGAAELFTASLDTPEEIAAYQGADAAALAKKFLDTVDKDKPATPESVEKAAGAVVAGQDPTGGQAPNPGGGGTGGGTPGPAETFTSTNSYGDLAAGASGGFMLVGSSNPATGFAKANIVGSAGTNIEIGLDARYYRMGTDVVPHATSPNGHVLFDVDGVNTVRYAYSVASESALDLNKFELRLLVDKNPGLAQDMVTLTLQADPLSTNGSPYKWVGPGGISVTDDGGSLAVTQNIQMVDWIDSSTDAFGPKDIHDVILQVVNKATGSVIGQSSITLADIDTQINAKLVQGAKDEKYIFNGSSNPNDNFAIVSTGTVELGLSGRYTLDKNIIAGIAESDGLVHFKMNATDAARFAYSVADASGAANIFKLKIDVDSGAGTQYVELVKTGANAAGDWVHSSGGKIADDGGNTTVSQNIQNIGWYDANTLSTAVAAGRYDVILEAYRADGVTLIAQNHVVFDFA